VHSLHFTVTGTPGEIPVLWTSRNGYTAALALPNRRDILRTALASAGRTEGAADPELRSPMPGTVVTVAAADGDTVEAGQVLLGVEAMKMEHQLTAPMAGRVSITLRPGDLVKAGQVLATVIPADNPGTPTQGAGNAEL
jgi:acetyl-CoA/propionyl-CoA carboxylase biotin carboxyl carrier protein